MKQKYLTTEQVSQLTGISQPSLKRQRMIGVGIPYHKIGRSVRYDIDDINEYLAANRVETAEAS